MHTKLGIAIFLLLFLRVGYGQSDARISLAQAEVTAGDTVDLSVSLDSPVPCSTGVFVAFMNKTQPVAEFDFSAMAQAGSSELKLRAVVPKDISPGDYFSSIGGNINPCPNYLHGTKFKVPVLALHVKPFRDDIRYPASAEISLSLTQKQFLETKTSEISVLRSKLHSRLERSSADLPDLRSFLIAVVQDGEKALNITREQYGRQIGKTPEEEPAFFADLHAQYEGLLVRLKAPIPGLGYKVTENRAVLLEVQLKTRPPAEHLSDTWPPDAIATDKLLSDNAAAYKYVKAAGRVTFSARLTSVPSGARIFYKKLVDSEYRDYSSPTDVSDASFELATWTFKFHKEECSDEPVETIDPYQDSHPNISVEFLHCRGR